MFDTLSRVDPASARPERHALDEALMDRHPVLRASPNPLRDRVSEAGRLHRCGSGERVVSEGAVGFVLRGSLAVFDRQELACVHLLGPGSTFGWEAALAPEQSGTPLLGLLDSEWIELPATVPTRAMGTGWVERVFARHALDRLTALQTASACHAVHAVPQRVANLIRRLSQVSDADVRTTQAALAKAVGVQRTSVNAAVKTLERAGALTVWRGRMRVKCPATLSHLACGC
jgi:CRP-like cAMP-binding protein